MIELLLQQSNDLLAQKPEAATAANQRATTLEQIRTLLSLDVPPELEDDVSKALDGLQERVRTLDSLCRVPNVPPKQPTPQIRYKKLILPTDTGEYLSQLHRAINALYDAVRFDKKQPGAIRKAMAVYLQLMANAPDAILREVGYKFHVLEETNPTMDIETARSLREEAQRVLAQNDIAEWDAHAHSVTAR